MDIVEQTRQDLARLVGSEEARRLEDQRVVDVRPEIADHRAARFSRQILAEIEQNAADEKHQNQEDRNLDHRPLAQPRLRLVDR